MKQDVLRAHSVLRLSAAAVVQSVPPAPEEDASDGWTDRRRHGLPQRQQVCPQRPGSPELHGGRGFRCQNRR